MLHADAPPLAAPDDDELAAFLAGIPAQAGRFPDNWILAVDGDSIPEEPAAAGFPAWTD